MPRGTAFSPANAGGRVVRPKHLRGQRSALDLQSDMRSICDDVDDVNIRERAGPGGGK